jgi:rSAM/selenodomain-associated transferase 1
MAVLLIIFAKEPLPGQVKTRLSPPLTPELAARLYHCFLEDILEEMARLTEIHLALAYSPAGAASFFRSLAPRGARLFPQEGRDLGERLIRACARGFAAGFQAVVVRNSDSPSLPRELVREAAEVLAAGRAQVALGPAPDGGYYLVGLTSTREELFQDLTWSRPTVLADTLQRARQLRLPVHLLPSWPDIDTPADLEEFLARPHPHPLPGWRSHRLGLKIRAGVRG